MLSRKLVLLFVMVCMMGFAAADVEIGSGVEFGQPDNSADINVTDRFNVSSLATYTDSTGFGGSNFSVLQGTGDHVDVRLSYYNTSIGAPGYAANFTANTSSANNITYDFTGLENSSLYEGVHGTTTLKRTESSDSGVLISSSIASQAASLISIWKTSIT